MQIQKKITTGSWLLNALCHIIKTAACSIIFYTTRHLCKNLVSKSEHLHTTSELLLVCVQTFSVNVLSTSGTPCLMMSVSTLFIGLDVVSCVLICLVTLGIVLGLVDFHLLLSILCVLLILSRLIRATISVFFVPCYPVLLSFYLVLSYMCELNKWRMEKRHKGVGCCALSDKMFSAARRMCSIRGCYRVEQIADCSTLWARRIQNSAVALRYMSVLSAAQTVIEDDRHAEFLQIGRSDAMDRQAYVRFNSCIQYICR